MKNLIEKCNEKQIDLALSIFLTINSFRFESREEAFQAVELLHQILSHCQSKEKIEEVLKHMFQKSHTIQFEKFKKEHIDDCILYKNIEK
jgi:predicted transcriptional regulator